MYASAMLIGVDLLFAAVMAGVGVAAGWWLFRGGSEGGRQDAQRLKEAVSRVRDLASSVAQDVGKHNTRVQEMSTDLTGAKENGGQLDQVVLDTVSSMIEANERLQSQLASAESKLEQQAEEIELHASDARTDQLTGMNNRRAFDDELGRRFAEWNRLETPYTLALIDVDHFKKFNDTYGHQAGDEVLKGVARVLRETSREMDIACRYGGEEFAIIMPATTVGAAQAGAERARRAIEHATFRFDGADLQVTASLGLAEIRPGEENEALIKRADDGLYAAKEAGRNRSWYHDGQSSHAVSLENSQAPVESREPDVAPVDPTLESLAAATEDALTPTLNNLPNQKMFGDELRRRMAEAQRYNVPLSLMLVDVDNYKRLSAQYGDEVGGLVLDTVAQYLEILLRDMDLLARFKGGKFSVMLPGSPLADTVGVAARVQEAIAQCVIPVADSQLQLTASIGLAQATAGDDTDSLIERADAALFASKAAGRSGAYLHNGETCQPAEAAAPVA